MNKPTCIITIGMGGAGKTTVLNRLFPNVTINDCDKWKVSHPDYDPKRPELVHEWSTIQQERERFQLLAKGETFAIDSTGKNIEKVARWINDAKLAGFNVHVLYVRVKVQTALARNAKRTRVVPLEVILEAAGMVETAYSVLSAYADSNEVIEND